MLLADHIDEVDDDDSAQVSQTQLPGNDLSGFEIRFKDGFREIPAAHKGPGIDVNRCHRFSLINDQIAAAFQFHTAPEGFFNLLVHPVHFKKRPVTAVVLDLIESRRHKPAGKGSEVFTGAAAVNQNPSGCSLHHVP